MDRWQDPEAGRLEAEINRGLERDGIGQRLCMHSDRTLTETGEGAARTVRVECDYCPQTFVATAGQPQRRLAPWYWRVPS